MAETLREGFTTGTAASAAANAAVALLLGGGLPETVTVALPPFIRAEHGWVASDSRVLCITIEGGALSSDNSAWASVIKDGGDDPDATHNARVRVYAACNPSALPARPSGVLSPAEGEYPSRTGDAARFPGTCVEVTGFSNAIFLYGGAGIGVVTLPGLPVAVGEPAINPEPRKQIAAAACRAAQERSYSGALHLMISVPEGNERALRTLNPRLGVLGGVSILGTSGIVRPYSHDAWRCAIEQGMSVAEALGIRDLLLCTGRRSERLGFSLYAGLPPQAGIQVADYAAFALRGAARRDFSHLRWICFPGKLLKLAQGLEWTHANAAAADISLLAGLCREAGATGELVREVERMPTAAGAFALMAAHDRSLHDAVLLRLAREAAGVLRGWLDAARAGTGKKKMRLTMHVFSLEGEELLSMDA